MKMSNEKELTGAHSVKAMSAIMVAKKVFSEGK
jgi:hypothetical protein